jgi:hypothetical protein
VWKISASDSSAEFFDDIKQPVSLPPVVADNYLYILDDSGRIHAWR